MKPGKTLSNSTMIGLEAPASVAAAAVDVIHGYGSSGAGGVLRKRLRLFLG